MDFQWTPHRFSGGALALDVANSVILRHDAERRIDRFAVKAQLERFCDAARRYCKDETLPDGLDPVGQENQSDFIALRERVDRYFRKRVLQDGRDDALALADLLESIAATIRRHGNTTATTVPLDLATATSALALLNGEVSRRMKICGNCGWLFIDRSRNKSRIWCDMAVCGNRTKASRHYRKNREVIT